ncbi:MAG: lipoyl(octanoyl) transferase LipB [Bacteroidales bacterium]|nr:MAG: lipoyl(octanoyl) transferase LipB [Bacteroidales bacterium]
MQQVVFEDLGLIDYKQAWDYQEAQFEKVMQQKMTANGDLHHLLFCEHPHVYTLGKSGEGSNLLISDETLKSINATYYRINRGGDITYHGPGQIVVYPIFNLEAFGITLKEYVHKLEEIIILFLKSYGINATRLDGATGVWLDVGVMGRERKICAIGVRASRFVTMHGLAFNINTDLNYFSYINPCGFIDKGVTSLQVELGKHIDMDDVKEKLNKLFASEFGFVYK